MEPSCGHLGANLGPSWDHLDAMWSRLAARTASRGLMLRKPYFLHTISTILWRQKGAKMSQNGSKKACRVACKISMPKSRQLGGILEATRRELGGNLARAGRMRGASLIKEASRISTAWARRLARRIEPAEREHGGRALRETPARPNCIPVQRWNVVGIVFSFCKNICQNAFKNSQKGSQMETNRKPE